MYTRKQYLNGECTHRQYYGEILDASGVVFGPHMDIVQMAKDSKDEHYNDIPLRWWDSVAMNLRNATKPTMTHRGDFWSMVGGVCLAKEAARRAVEKLNA